MVEAPLRRLRLVLHAGTPKTGTSALQRALYRHADDLERIGIWYPPADVDPVKKKHQYLVGLLLDGDEAALRGRFDDIARAAPPQTHTIVLSTEGLFNHWWDYSATSKALLRDVTARFDVRIWTCFRPPVEFAVSQYAQLLRNPKQDAPAYGLDADLETMLENAWFAKRLDYAGYIREAEAAIGAGNVRAFRYGPDIVQRIFHALGAPEPEAEQVHPSLRAAGVALMRTVNRYDLPADEQHRAARLVLELDTLIGERAEAVRASPAAQRRIRELSAGSWELIEAMTTGEGCEAVR